MAAIPTSAQATPAPTSADLCLAAALRRRAEVIPIGKHAGDTFGSALDGDKRYCAWLIGQARPGKLAPFADWLRSMNFRPTSPSDPTKRVYLNVPFPRRGEAQKLGAEYDDEHRSWFAPDNSFAELLKTFPAAKQLALAGEDRSFGKGLLLITATPATCLDTGVRDLLPSGDWEDLRRLVTSRTGRKCEECDASIPAGAKVHIIERWSYDDTKHTRKLLRFEVACEKCYRVSQLMKPRDGESYLQARSYLVSSRGLSDEAALDKALVETFTQWVERSRVEWTDDLSVLLDSGLKVKA